MLPYPLSPSPLSFSKFFPLSFPFPSFSPSPLFLTLSFPFLHLCKKSCCCCFCCCCFCCCWRCYCLVIKAADLKGSLPIFKFSDTTTQLSLKRFTSSPLPPASPQKTKKRKRNKKSSNDSSQPRRLVEFLVDFGRC